VIHKDVSRQNVVPSQLAGFETEIILLTVSSAESIFVKQAHLAKTIAPDIHAESTSGRERAERLAIGDGKRPIHLRNGGIGRQWVWFAKTWEAAKIGVVGKRRYGSDARMRVCGSSESRKPIARDFRVAVQQHNVGVVVEGHAPIRAGDETSVAVVLQQDNFAGLGQLTEVFGKRWFGASIVDDDDVAGRPAA
jgi:hypothetical protein